MPMQEAIRNYLIKWKSSNKEFLSSIGWDTNLVRIYELCDVIVTTD
jgi:hypothetical protein